MVLNRRAIVVGGGIAGLSAGIALRQAGLDVAIYEQAPKLEPMGAALSMWPNAMQALALLKCDEMIRKDSVPISIMTLAEAAGRPIFEIAVADILDDAEAYLPRRTLLQRSLLQGLGDAKVHLSHKVHKFSQQGDGVSVTFENGEVAEADLLIAADGIRSSIAGDILGKPVHHCGYGGVLGMSGPVSIADDIQFVGELWGYKERFGLFDLTDGGKYWFYMKNEKAREESEQISLEFISDRMRAWHPAIMATLDQTRSESLIPFSIHAKPPPVRLGGGRVICVGDAAHAMEPNMGQGGCQSLEDAIALGEACKSSDIAAILPRFEKMRLKRVRQFVKMSKQGAIASHRLPKPLFGVSNALMRGIMPLGAKRQMRNLYQLPDYAAMGA